jgi:hypothetical protein
MPPSDTTIYRIVESNNGYNIFERIKWLIKVRLY